MNSIWWRAYCSVQFSNILLTAPPAFLHQAATSPTRYRTSTLDLVFSNYSSRILSNNHLAPLSKSDHATLQVNTAVSKQQAVEVHTVDFVKDFENEGENEVLQSSCGGLKYTFLDGSREYTSGENSREPLQCAVPQGLVKWIVLCLKFLPEKQTTDWSQKFSLSLLIKRLASLRLNQKHLAN